MCSILKKHVHRHRVKMEGKARKTAMTSKPTISIVIPCRNEGVFISTCLESILKNDYDHSKLEILVVDGMSEDSTISIIKDYARQHPFIKLLQNSRRITPAALNVGIRVAQGDIIIRMDVHASYAKDYLDKCVRNLLNHGADNVGGIWITLPREDTLMGNAIALALSHVFGAGNAYFRTGSKTPRWVDTVPFFCCRKQIFDKVGLFDENLARSQDMDFNRRLKEAGGRILLVPDIVSYYYARSTLAAFSKHNFVDGFWTIYPLRFGKRIFNWRHLVPLAFVTSVIGSAILSVFSSFFSLMAIGILSSYFLVSIAVSIQLAIKHKRPMYMLALPMAFTARHIPYGLGSSYGLLRLASAKWFWRTLFGYGKRTPYGTTEKRRK